MKFFLFLCVILAFSFFTTLSQAALYSVDHMVLMDNKGNLRAKPYQLRRALRELAWSDADIEAFLNLRAPNDRLNFSRDKESGKPAKSLIQFDDE